jgi:hypothetical protein
MTIIEAIAAVMRLSGGVGVSRHGKVASSPGTV